MGLNSAVADMVTCRPGYTSEREILELKLKVLTIHRAQDGCGRISPENWRGLNNCWRKPFDTAYCLVAADGSRGLGGSRATSTHPHPHPIQTITGFHGPTGRAKKSFSSF